MIQQHNAVGIRLVAGNGKKAGLDARNRGENRPQQIRLGGIDGDGQNTARRQFQNGAAILTESVRRRSLRGVRERRVSNQPAARVLKRKVTSSSAPGFNYSQLQEVLASVAPLRPHRHEVRFYPDDTSFLDGFARFVSSALKAGDAVIVVATELHRNALLHRLHSDGLEIGTAIKDGRYISMDVADTLSTFMVNDLPDPVRFLKVAGELVATAAKAAKGDRQRVAACGECAPYLLAAGKTHAAIRLEQLWDRIAKTYDVDILCGYPLIGFGRPQESPVFQRICAEHSASYSG